MPCFSYISILGPNAPELQPDPTDDTPTVVTADIVRYVQKFDAESGNTLIWTKNGGKVPNDITAWFEVYANGNKLDYPAEYTVFPYSGTGQSTITITYPTPNAYYTVIGTFINGD